MAKYTVKSRWSPTILTNILCLFGLLVVVFSVTVFTQNERQRELLYRRVRSLTADQKQRRIREFLPPLIQLGSEWRFESNQTVGDCSQIPLNYQHETLVGQGYSKQVYRYGQMAVKRPMLREGKAFQECVQKSTISEEQCLEIEIHGFLSEIGLILQLQDDPNVPKLFAYCIPFDETKQTEELALVVELGEPIDLIKYIDLGWKQRLKFVSEVLEFLERLQPLTFLDFRRQQFTLRQNQQQPMYVDFDNVVLQSNNTSADTESARKVYKTFANKYLWIGRPAGSAAILSRIRRQFDRNELGLTNFKEAINELKNTDFI